MWLILWAILEITVWVEMGVIAPSLFYYGFNGVLCKLHYVTNNCDGNGQPLKYGQLPYNFNKRTW